MLRDLQPVIDRFQGAPIHDPIQDLINRGVDPRAVDDFTVDCLTSAVGHIDPNKIMPMLISSAFHMGMLTQQYVSEMREKEMEI